MLLIHEFASLNPINSFHEFDKLKVMRLSEFYPEDFISPIKRMTREHNLGFYIYNIREDERFFNLKDHGGLACMMVESTKHLSHHLVY